MYRTEPFSMTLNDPYPRFQGHAILWGWISQRRYENRHSFNGILIGYGPSDIHTPYLTVSFRMTLDDLEWLSKIFNNVGCQPTAMVAMLFISLSARLCCLSNAMHGQNMNLPVCVCLSVCPSHFMSTRQRIFTVDSLKDADLRKDVPSGDLDDE